MLESSGFDRHVVGFVCKQIEDRCYPVPTPGTHWLDAVRFHLPLGRDGWSVSSSKICVVIIGPEFLFQISSYTYAIES